MLRQAALAGWLPIAGASRLSRPYSYRKGTKKGRDYQEKTQLFLVYFIDIQTVV
jgi:hypothetical protein